MLAYVHHPLFFAGAIAGTRSTHRLAINADTGALSVPEPDTCAANESGALRTATHMRRDYWFMPPNLASV
jgi:hypothetical protein